MRIQDIDLSQLSIEELKQLSDRVWFIIKQKRAVKVANISQRLNIGDTVTINHDKVRDLLFKIVKLNPKKVKVTQINKSWVTYNVPYDLVMPKVENIDDILNIKLLPNSK